jgi:hypothetical protein
MGQRYQLLAELQCSEYIEIGVEAETAKVRSGSKADLKQRSIDVGYSFNIGHRSRPLRGTGNYASRAPKNTDQVIEHRPEAAIRSENDLFELLNPPQAVKITSRAATAHAT